MKKPFNKRRFWLIVGIAAVVELAIVVANMQWKKIFPTGEVSELYARYERAEGIEVSFVKDFRLNDSVVVDVTLIKATADSAWHGLQCDFGIPVIPKEYEALYYSDSNTVDVKLAPKGQPNAEMDSIVLNNNIVSVSFPKRMVGVFDIRSMPQLKSILHNEFNKSIIITQTK